ncbi:MAG: pseudouridine synthase [Limnobacter sp.]|nr:pseudouridine synthase [Limnobacter sp.]
MKIKPSIKLLQSQGLGSRAQCEFIFENSEIIRNGTRLDPETDEIKMGDILEIDGEVIKTAPFLYLMMNKPVGFEISHKPSMHQSVFTLLPTRMMNRNVQAAGRLDNDTSGALVFSDDGQFIHRLISGKKGKKFEIEKIYIIETAEPVTERQIADLLAGVALHDEPELVAASQAWLREDGKLVMGINTGKYHQVRRMIAAAGNHVTGLHRQSVGPYTLPADLPEGSYIEIDPSLL